MGGARTAEAEVLYRRAVAAAPDFADAQLRLAILLREAAEVAAADPATEAGGAVAVARGAEDGGATLLRQAEGHARAGG